MPVGGREPPPVADQDHGPGRAARKKRAPTRAPEKQVEHGHDQDRDDRGSRHARRRKKQPHDGRALRAYLLAPEQDGQAGEQK